jgi:hypothetical protein
VRQFKIYINCFDRSNNWIIFIMFSKVNFFASKVLNFLHSFLFRLYSKARNVRFFESYRLRESWKVGKCMSTLMQSSQSNFLISCSIDAFCCATHEDEHWPVSTLVKMALTFFLHRVGRYTLHHVADMRRHEYVSFFLKPVARTVSRNFDVMKVEHKIFRPRRQEDWLFKSCFGC